MGKKKPPPKRKEGKLIPEISDALAMLSELAISDAV